MACPRQVLPAISVAVALLTNAVNKNRQINEVLNRYIVRFVDKSMELFRRRVRESRQTEKISTMFGTKGRACVRHYCSVQFFNRSMKSSDIPACRRASS